jgi:hypothetical protein
MQYSLIREDLVQGGIFKDSVVGVIKYTINVKLHVVAGSKYSFRLSSSKTVSRKIVAFTRLRRWIFT